MPMPMDEIFYYRLGQKRAGGGSGGTGGGTGGGGGSDEGWINDGNTHIWISLPEGRTSPILGVCPNGTVTVDWGDGTEPDVLTGTNRAVVRWTPTHNYASAGDYVITLTVDGEMGLVGEYCTSLLRFSTSYTDNRNRGYARAIKKAEIGNNVPILVKDAFYHCTALESITIPNSVTSIGNNAFHSCYALESVNILDGVTSIGNNAFCYCYALESVTIPNSVTSIGDSAFFDCHTFESVTIPNSVTSISANAFRNCYALESITIPNSVTSIGSQAISSCYALTKIRFDPVVPPTLSSSNAFNYIPSDCIISVPTGSLEAYTTATNYPDPATYTYIEED